MIFIHLDGDDIGPVFELFLLDNAVDLARNYSSSVAQALELVGQELSTFDGVDVIAVGGDDIVAGLPGQLIDMQDIERLRQLFLEACGRTMSAGVGSSTSEATGNLRRAKLMGKNVVVSSPLLTKDLTGAEA